MHELVFAKSLAWLASRLVSLFTLQKLTSARRVPNTLHLNVMSLDFLHRIKILHEVKAAILMYHNNERAAMRVKT